jgi:serine/threonine-protein kinase
VSTWTAHRLSDQEPSTGTQVDLPRGRVIAGRFRVERVLGRGGTSTVYAATHTFTHRAVALKLLTQRHAEHPETAARFLREARAATALVHRNAVEVLDMGIDESGAVYLAMEMLEGDTLYEVLQREHHMDPARLTELVLPVIDALAAAHRLGIVHRDLKPENIQLAREPDGSLRPVLLDFGIAKMLDAKRTTEVGMILGTPYYMSPEQIEGRSVSPTSDVWSMGVVIYECLTGVLPFDQAGLPALFMAITKNEHRAVRDVMPEISPGWDWTAWDGIIERALSHDPDSRFQNAGELAAAIRGVPSGLLVPDPGLTERDAGEQVSGRLEDDRQAGALLPTMAPERMATQQENEELPSLHATGRRARPWMALGVAGLVMVALAAFGAASMLGASDAPPALDRETTIEREALANEGAIEIEREAPVDPRSNAETLTDRARAEEPLDASPTAREMPSATSRAAARRGRDPEPRSPDAADPSEMATTARPADDISPEPAEPPRADRARDATRSLPGMETEW